MFRRRCRISGVLEATAPVHIGDGNTVEVVLDDGKQWREGDARFKRDGAIQVNTVARDAEGKPCIPGSTLKGVLRAWLDSHVEAMQAAECLLCLFGSQELGGAAEFLNARLTKAAEVEDRRRWWRETSATCIGVNVKLRERTRTAEEDQLFHAEFVPEGTQFRVQIEGEGISDDGLGLLLRSLKAFNDKTDPVLIGADSGNGWGRMQWTLGAVETLGEVEARQWIARVRSGEAILAGQGYRKLSDSEARVMEQSGMRRFPAVVQRCVVEVQVRLRFDGPFLVNDASQVKKGLAHSPLKKTKNRVFLPGSSFRGALRAQAARIFNTIGGKNRKRDGKEEAKSTKEVKELRPFLKLFGAPGWRAPVSVHDFELESGGLERVQEFLAIDRFTGGGADRRKFNAGMAEVPVLTGQMELDMSALARADTGPWSMALLLFLLRDLSEGDVTFGFGASKGYGACQAEIEAVTLRGWEVYPEGLGDPKEARQFFEGLKAFPYGLGDSTQNHGALRGWVEELKSAAVGAR